jgi:hypothetical protein
LKPGLGHPGSRHRVNRDRDGENGTGVEERDRERLPRGPLPVLAQFSLLVPGGRLLAGLGDCAQCAAPGLL